MMAENTSIEWTNATWNPIAGCSIVSAGCTNCYAMNEAYRQQIMAKGAGRTSHYDGTTRLSGGRQVWTGKVNVAPDHILRKPLTWRKPRMIFVNSMSDLFHEDVPIDVIDKVFAIMALCPQHTFQVLTKRPDRMRDYLHCKDRAKGISTTVSAWDAIEYEMFSIDPHAPEREWPLPNVWLGTSIEDQKTADERIPALLETPAAVRWISAEPLLGQVELQPWLSPDKFCERCDDGWGNMCGSKTIPRSEQCPWGLAVQIETLHGPFEPDGAPSHITSEVRTLDWVVVGGESGPDARPMHPDWVRQIRDQCAAADVPFLFKQWGAWGPLSDDCEAASDCLWHGKKTPYTVIKIDGSQREANHLFPSDIENETGMFRVGKKRAGRMLDGVVHDGYPTGKAGA